MKRKHSHSHSHSGSHHGTNGASHGTSDSLHPGPTRLQGPPSEFDERRRVGEKPDARLFLNRELSWLEFNGRVLLEGADASLPLYERLKFLGIVSSNLDEFFMVRVSGLKHQLISGLTETPADGLLAAEQLLSISDRVHAMTAEQHRLWRESLLPALAAQQIQVLGREAFTVEQRVAGRNFFMAQVFPALTPLAVDPGHPFPHLRNKSLNIAVLLRKDDTTRRRLLNVPHDETLMAVVQVPQVLGRLVRLPTASLASSSSSSSASLSAPSAPAAASPDGVSGIPVEMAPSGAAAVDNGTPRAFVLLEELIAAHVGELFPGYAVLATAPFRVTRDWDLHLDEEESEDLLSTIMEELRRRDRGMPVRLEIAHSAPVDLRRELVGALKLEQADIYSVQGPLQLQDLHALADADPRPELRHEPLNPSIPALLRDVESLFPVLRAQDVLLHHPYESFDPVVRFIEEAADDPDVLAIKMTLYRAGGDSPFVRAFARAADNGKQVTAFVELKARFDEANNIAWARRLEENGVHVVYGLIGLKTHCKVALVVRREGHGIRRYVHLGTGNYNPTTARQYTDLSLFTTREEIADDVSALFNMLTGYAEPPQWKRLRVAPFGLQERVLQLIDNEADHARRGQPSRIVAKMNSLVDPVVIRALYAASQAGVEIDLLVRGICCLRAGVAGLSERIRVTSVVDRFLEHSRVFAFGTGERTEVYLSSADWMPRNFHRRIEVMFPVESPLLRQRLIDEVLGLILLDNVKASRLLVDGHYQRRNAEGLAIRSQVSLLNAARLASEPATREAVPVIRQAAAPSDPGQPLPKPPVPASSTSG